MSDSGVSILEQPLAFVDIETNGLNHIRGRVIEVAAIRVEHGKVVKSFNSLVDPETELPTFITKLTGIKEADLEGAPSFRQISDELRQVLDGAIFVAHNVRFDYSFLKQEFKRLDQSFLPKQLCTVKLSRVLYPHETSHKLESIIARHGFTFSARHRAYDDAAVLWQFIQYIEKHFPPEQIAAAIAQQIMQPALPKSLQPEIVRNLPETSGVYIFEDETGQPLYVGKSINIKKRVLSHFGRDHAESREFKIAQTIKHITTHETDGELAALLLESRLVKQLQPLYNRRLRRMSKLLLVKQREDEQGYYRAIVEEADTIDPAVANEILAIYPRRSRAKQSLTDMVKTFDLCPKLMGLERSDGACFLRQLHKCRGACAGMEPPSSYNQRLLMAFDRQRIQAWPYKGAVIVREVSTNESTQAIIVDQWCVIGEVKQEAYCEPVVTAAQKAFDLDTYKILQSQLTSKRHNLTIQPVDPQQLSLLGV